MVITRVISGLGNQMFQYAAGFALARRVGGVPLRLDIDFYKSNRLRAYELERFRLSAQPMSATTRLRVEADLRIGSRHLLRRAVRRVLRPLPVRHFDYCTDAEQAMAEQYWQSGDYTVLGGFWQNEAYFIDAVADLRREFIFRRPPDQMNQAVLDQIRATPIAVCVHVRRGDYLTGREVLAAADIGYYRAALQYSVERFPTARYFVFGDDPDWAQQHIPVPAGSTFVTHNVGRNDPEDMRLMSACRHFIIANSTFSWWGAWLSVWEDKVVVAPARWFAIAHPNESVIVPQRWIRMS